MAAIGIDYGTSNSEVVFFDGQDHHFVALDPLAKNSNKIRSSIFIYYEDELPLPQPELVEKKIVVIQRAIQDQLEKAKQGYYEAQDPKEQAIYSDRIDSLRAEFHNKPALQRKAIQLIMRDMDVQSLSLKQLVETGSFAFGEEGFRRFLKTPEKGRLIYSPKNFLGASLSEDQQIAFVGMIAKQLGYFRECAETQLETPIKQAVIGRPVRFHGTRGEAGNQQAVSILSQAAKKAGFEDIQFLEEPIAAAYKIEQELTQTTNALVVDIGGGTTDICCIRLASQDTSQTEQERVLGVTGTRLGGMECDKNLVVKAIAPHLGQAQTLPNGLPVPPTYFTDMCAVDDIPKLTRFFSDEYGLDIAQTMSLLTDTKKLSRLLSIQEEKLSARVVNSSRMAKELLSSQDSITLPLHYVEENFDVNIDTDMLKLSMRPWLKRVLGLINDCLAQSSEKPEMLFITGGMSLSPIVVDAVKDNLESDLQTVEGDAFNSVCEGLAIKAAKINSP